MSCWLWLLRRTTSSPISAERRGRTRYAVSRRFATSPRAGYLFFTTKSIAVRMSEKCGRANGIVCTLSAMWRICSTRTSRLSPQARQPRAETSRGHRSRRDYVAASSGIRRSMLSDPRCIVPGIASEDEARLPERVFPVTPPRHYVASKSLRTSGKKSSMPHCVSASRVRVQEQNSPSFL